MGIDLGADHFFTVGSVAIQSDMPLRLFRFILSGQVLLNEY